MSDLRPVVSVHIDIAEFVLLVLEMPESERGAWVTNLARCLAKRDPAMDAYGARLLAEADQFRRTRTTRNSQNAQKGWRNRNAKSDAVASDCAQSDAVASDLMRNDTTDRADSTDRQYPPSPNGDTPKRQRPTAIIPPSLQITPEFLIWWQKWKDHRRQARHPLTLTEEQLQLSRLVSEPDPIAVITAAISGGCQRLWREPAFPPAIPAARQPPNLPPAYIDLDAARAAAKLLSPSEPDPIQEAT